MHLGSSQEANLRACVTILSSGFLSKLRHLLLRVMTTAVKTVPITSPATVQKAAKALADVVRNGTELDFSAVVLHRIHLPHVSQLSMCGL